MKRSLKNIIAGFAGGEGAMAESVRCLGLATQRVILNMIKYHVMT